MSFCRTQGWKLIVIAAVVLCFAALELTRAEKTATAPAAVTVQGSAQLGVGTMADNARINSNRNYYFTNVPKCIRGLKYISHMHRTPATVACTAKTGGRMYLCLADGNTPARLKLGGKWKTAGKIGVMEGGSKHPWTVYSIDVTPGQKLTIPSPGKWGSVLVAGKINSLKPLAKVGKGKPAPRRPSKSRSPRPKAPRDQFELLASQISTWRKGGSRYDRLVKEALHKNAFFLPADRDPADVVLRRTAGMLADIRKTPGAPDLSAQAGELAKLQAACAKIPATEAAARRKLYDDACKLRRRIAFSNPLLNFDKIIFATHHKTHGHMCDQYFGFHARPGGSIYILDKPFSDSPTVRDVLKDAKIRNGRLKGRTLAGGSHMSLELSYDAKTILFAWTEGEKTRYKWSERSTYHIFRANIEPGKPVNLTQLTDGKWNDFDPCFMPSGRILFISERRGGFGRCHGRPVPTYTLHTMKPDGSDIIPISYHETNEWHPSIDNNGMIVYSRWDYVDRDSDVAHHIWLTYPDGRDPRSYHGNYPKNRSMRPWMELAIRSVPESHRYIATAAPHHGQNYGSLVLIDQQLEDDNACSQLKRITPEVAFPESERGKETYGQPWALSENYYLCVYDPNARHYGVYLVDGFGNRELLYNDPSVPCLDPIPLRPRTKPRIIPAMTTQAAEDKAIMPESQATVSVMNVYDSDFKWPEGSKVKALRIVQLFPKATPNVDRPRVGLAAQALTRGVLGTVPVEEDGSAYFIAPVGVPIYFQALDAQGQAIQSMKSNTYVHASEKLACQGCHEPKLRMSGAKTKIAVAAALKRPPSKIAPDVSGSYPLTFPRLVQPVIDKKCLPCHVKSRKEGKGKKAPNLSGTEFGRNGWSKAFETLHKYGWGKSGGNGAIRRNGGCTSIAGKIGAKGSKLLPHLTGPKGHNDLKLTPEELYRITLWIDCNTNFYGAYLQTEKQARGGLVMPSVK